MNAEYQRLEAEAREVQRQMESLSVNVLPDSVPEQIRFEREIIGLGRKRAAMRHGQALIRKVNSDSMRQRERKFIASLPKRFHSQRT